MQEIYGGKYGSDSPNTNAHVQSDVDYADKQGEGLAPVGGPHWGATGCGEDPASAPALCGPVPWGIFDEPWDPESLVHTMEHTGVVAWYNTEDQAIIEELEDWARGNDDKYLVLSPYPDLAADTVAITSWGRRLTMPAAELDTNALQNFLDSNACRFDPEGFCE